MTKLPSPSQRFSKKTAREGGLKQTLRWCISWTVYSLNGSYPKCTEAIQSPNNLAICSGAGASPCVQGKEGQTCEEQKCYTWNFPKCSNRSPHTVPEMPACEWEYSICLCCSPYSLPTALWGLFLIIDLLTPHRPKTFLFRVIFAESTACFYILFMFQVLSSGTFR